MHSWPGTMQEEVDDQMDKVEVYQIINGMCRDEGMKELKFIRGECQDTRFLPMEEKRGMRCTKLQQNHCMNKIGKSTFCIVNSNEVCTSTQLANLI